MHSWKLYVTNFSKSDAFSFLFFFILLIKRFIIKQMSHIQCFIEDRHIGFCKKNYTPLKNHVMSNYRLQILSEWRLELPNSDFNI